jgi:tRNA (adenine22-N1)-methyltransferase
VVILLNVNQLSKRLERVSSYIPEEATIADIGSDHAYLPCFAVLNLGVMKAIAGEVVDGPFHSAKEQVKLAGLTEKIDVRKGNGLAVLTVGEVDCVIIAGMGGSLITSILENGKNKLVGTKRLILQPNIAAFSIRKWLSENGWHLSREEILEEDHKIYEILVADKREYHSPYSNAERDLLMGPILVKEKSDVFYKKWTYELQQRKMILSRLENAQLTEETIQKKKELHQQIQIIEEALSNETS